MKKGLLWATLVIFLLAGCASVKVTKIEDEKTEGVRFYRSEPYFWVTWEKDDKGKESWKCQVIYLPNKKQEYVAKVSSGLGTVDAKFTLENGWNLTQFGETRDSKIPETINAVTGTLATVSKMSMGMGLKAEGKPLLHPGLYRLVFDEKSGSVVRIEPVLVFEPAK